jgi:hypothetical protein
VSDIPTRRVTRQENVTKISHLSQPRVWLEGHDLGLEPLDGQEAILDSSREPTFWTQLIVRRHDHGLQLQSKAETVVLTIGPRAGANAEAAAVDVVQGMELGGGRGRESGWLVEAELKVVSSV